MSTPPKVTLQQSWSFSGCNFIFLFLHTVNNFFIKVVSAVRMDADLMVPWWQVYRAEDYIQGGANALMLVFNLCRLVTSLAFVLLSNGSFCTKDALELVCVGWCTGSGHPTLVILLRSSLTADWKCLNRSHAVIWWGWIIHQFYSHRRYVEVVTGN